LKSNKSFWSLPFGVQYKGKENLLKIWREIWALVKILWSVFLEF
jgi:hypothetical protein